MEAVTGRLIGNYRVGRLLGQGGMGAVYSAGHAALRLPCALKVFTADGAKKEFLRKRFLAEGRLLARLDHPRLVKVRDLAVDEASGAPYFAMDLVLDQDGEPCTLEDWREWLAECHEAAVRHILENTALAETSKTVFRELERTGDSCEAVAKRLGLSAVSVRQIKSRVSRMVTALERRLLGDEA